MKILLECHDYDSLGKLFDVLSDTTDYKVTQVMDSSERETQGYFIRLEEMHVEGK